MTGPRDEDQELDDQEAVDAELDDIIVDATPSAAPAAPLPPRLELTVEEKTRLDVLITDAVKPLGPSRTAVQGWIDANRVRVQRGPRQVATKPGLKLEPGDVVTVEIPAPPPPPAPLAPEAIPLAILHQDDHVLVLDKPAGMTVHPGAGQREGTLAGALLHAAAGRLSGVGGPDRPGIVHRLDKDTSGVIVVARDDAAHRHLAKQFHDRTVTKAYLAIVEGLPRDQVTIDAPLGRHPRDRKRMAIVEGGRPAQSDVTTVERFEGPFALVEVRPKTGRTHQIRVHLKSIHCPILADPTYGRGPTFAWHETGLPGERGRILLSRHALHAARLSFTHPATGKRLTFEAKLPDDMAATLDALREATRRAMAT